MKDLIEKYGSAAITCALVFAAGLVVGGAISKTTAVATFEHPDEITIFVNNPVTGGHASLDCATFNAGDISIGVDVDGHVQSYNCVRGEVKAFAE